MKIAQAIIQVINFIGGFLCLFFIRAVGFDHVSNDLLAVLVISASVLLSSSFLLGSLKRAKCFIAMISINSIMFLLTLLWFVSSMGDDLAEFTGWFLIFNLPYLVNAALFNLNRKRVYQNI
jgi:hypothetical protein